MSYKHYDYDCAEMKLLQPIINDVIKPQLDRENGVSNMVLRCGCLRMMRDYNGDKKCDLCGHLAKQHLRSAKSPQLFCMVLVNKVNPYVKIESEKVVGKLKLADEILDDEQYI